MDNLAATNPSTLTIEFEKERASRIVKFEEVSPAEKQVSTGENVESTSKQMILSSLESVFKGS